MILSKHKLIFTLPTSLNFLIGKLNYTNCFFLYIYNTNFFFVCAFHNLIFFYDFSTRNLFFKKSQWLMSKKFIFLSNFFIQTLFKYFFRKIKYNGKSFKIEKIKSNLFLFKFGHANKSYIYLKNKNLKRIKKIKFFLFFLNLSKTNAQLFKIFKLRSWNKYTQRGLKLNKKIIYKQQGKKSTYV